MATHFPHQQRTFQATVPEIRAALALFPAAAALSQSPHLLIKPVIPGFSGANVWRIQVDVGSLSGRPIEKSDLVLASGAFEPHVIWGEFALRQMPPGEINLNQLCTLRAILDHTRNSARSPVAVPCLGERGEMAVFCANAWWMLEPWLPGMADYHSFPTTARLRSAFLELARWHRASRETPYLPPEWQPRRAISPRLVSRQEMLARWTPAYRRAIGERLNQLDPSPFVRVAQRILSSLPILQPGIARELELATSRSLALQPCWGDLWHDHLLFTDATLTGLIDPHAACCDGVALDLARLLGSLHPDDTLAWEQALTAYADVEPVTDELRWQIAVYDCSSVLLSALRWIERWLETPSGWPQSDRITHRLTQFADRIQRWSDVN